MWPRVAESDWSIEDRQLILAGRVRHGMDQSQVYASWGAPLDEGSPGGETGVDRRWTYGDRFAVFSGNGLIAFQRTGGDEPVPTPKICPRPWPVPGAERTP